jgi:hypothetical protein
MTIAHKDFGAYPTTDLQTALREANAWQAETAVSVINIETRYKEGYFNKEDGIRVWYHAPAPGAAQSS